MKKINADEIKKLLKSNNYYWARDKIYINSHSKTIIINNCSKERYNEIVLSYNTDLLELKIKSKTGPKVPKIIWKQWELDFIRKYKGDYNVLKYLLPHRTKSAIKDKYRRLFF